MNIYNRSSLIAFYDKHPDCKEVLERWYNDILSKNRRKPGDVTKDSILPGRLRTTGLFLRSMRMITG